MNMKSKILLLYCMYGNGHRAIAEYIEKEDKVFKQTKLRNLKRKYAKMRKHADLLEECIDLKCEIDSLERELNS